MKQDRLIQLNALSVSSLGALHCGINPDSHNQYYIRIQNLEYIHDLLDDFEIDTDNAIYQKIAQELEALQKIQDAMGYSIRLSDTISLQGLKGQIETVLKTLKEECPNAKDISLFLVSDGISDDGTTYYANAVATSDVFPYCSLLANFHNIKEGYFAVYSGRSKSNTEKKLNTQLNAAQKKLDALTADLADCADESFKAKKLNEVNAKIREIKTEQAALKRQPSFNEYISAALAKNKRYSNAWKNLAELVSNEQNEDNSLNSTGSSYPAFPFG